MPELPEVETIVRDLRKNIIGKKIVNVFASKEKFVRNISFEKFKKEILGKEILEVNRRGKYILIKLSLNYILLIHLKMTGRVILEKDDYTYFTFELSDGSNLYYSDPRQFGIIELYKEGELKLDLGVEPLSKEFTFEKLKKIVNSKKTNIKNILMDQKLIAGIGNIYASEILFRAGVNPERKNLTDLEIEKIHEAIIFILKKAIELKGDSISDYIRIDGTRGGYQNYAKVYGRKGEKCFNCGEDIKYVKINQRGTFYCPKCQK
jgi:formamidopyrimidine-DNA glycosylase